MYKILFVALSAAFRTGFKTRMQPLMASPELEAAYAEASLLGTYRTMEAAERRSRSLPGGCGDWSVEFPAPVMRFAAGQRDDPSELVYDMQVLATSTSENFLWLDELHPAAAVVPSECAIKARELRLELNDIPEFIAREVTFDNPQDWITFGFKIATIAAFKAGEGWAVYRAPNGPNSCLWTILKHAKGDLAPPPRPPVDAYLNYARQQIQHWAAGGQHVDVAAALRTFCNDKGIACPDDYEDVEPELPPDLPPDAPATQFADGETWRRFTVGDSSSFAVDVDSLNRVRKMSINLGPDAYHKDIQFALDFLSPPERPSDDPPADNQ